MTICFIWYLSGLKCILCYYLNLNTKRHIPNDETVSKCK